MGVRTAAHSTDFSDIVQEDVEAHLKEAAEVSMGTEIAEEDVDNISQLCIAAGTPVSMADGTAARIEDVRVGSLILTRVGGVLVPRRVTNAFSRGTRPCVELLFVDGRKLVCTPDHRILTADGEWVEARALEIPEVRLVSVRKSLTGGGEATVVGGSLVASAVNFPLVDTAASNWQCRAVLPALGYALNMAGHRVHALAFARLVGYLSTDGTLTCGHATIMFGHLFDAATALEDVELLTGLRPAVVEPTEDDNVYRLKLPMSLARAMVAIGLDDGERVNKPWSLPAFVTAADCPTAVLQEFLGGYFGGDGMTPSYRHQKGWRGNGIAGGMTTVGFCLTKKGDHVRATATQLRDTLVPLLARAGVDVGAVAVVIRRAAPCLLSAAGRKQAKKLKAKGRRLSKVIKECEALKADQSYNVFLLLGTDATASFARTVGFRHCVHKALRLAAATQYHTGKQFIIEQRDRLRTLMTAERALASSFRLASMRAVATMAVDESVHPLNVCWAHLVRKSNYLRSGRKDSVAGYAIDSVLAECDTRRFFSRNRETRKYSATASAVDEKDSDSDTGSDMELSGSEDEEDDEMSDVESTVVYALERASVGLPLFQAKLVAVRPVVDQVCWDLTVEEGESFVANGIVVHNCDQVVNIAQYRASLYEYLKHRMNAIAPNLTVMVGELVGARLIAHAGSLLSLAKQPASTVQILGAEKALFRALKTKKDQVSHVATRMQEVTYSSVERHTAHSLHTLRLLVACQTPKYGLIYHASLVGQAAPKLKGKVCRACWPPRLHSAFEWTHWARWTE